MQPIFRQALAAASAFAIASFAANALATIQRTFVASTGVDTNACSITSPCRGFAAAVAKTSANGEVIVVDSAGYGTVVISKSISLIAPAGVYAGVTVFTGDGITVDTAGIAVVLRGLTINGQGGVNGINLLQSARLRIENCVISNMSGDGILHSAPGAELVVVDTMIRDNQGTGLDIFGDGSIVLEHVRSERNTFDGFALNPLFAEVHVSITNSAFASNGRHGINIGTGPANAVPRVVIDRSALVHNLGHGLLQNSTTATSFVGLTRTTIHSNGSYGARVRSLGDLAILTIAENTMTENAKSIGADGIGAMVLASANSITSSGLGMERTNGATFISFGNNIGSFNISAGIIQQTGQ